MLQILIKLLLVRRMNEFELINQFLKYCKELIGCNNWDNRFNSIKDFLVNIKTKPIFFEPKNGETGITYVSPIDICKDIPMWYLFNLCCYIQNSEYCDLTLIARIAPKIIRIAESLDLLQNCNGFFKKFSEILHPKTKNFENTLFEILVACSYLRNGAKNVTFLFDKTKKMADLSVDFNGPLFIECKRKAKESSYNKHERECWYKQYLPIQDYLVNNHISLVLKVTFHNEINSYPYGYLYSLVIDKIKNEKIFSIENEDVSIITYKPDFNSVNNQSDSKFKKYSPSLFKLLFKRDNDLYGITPFMYGKGDLLTDYIYDITEASAGLWYCDSTDALSKKSISFKKLICEAIDQIPDKQSGAIHIGYESYDGNIVEEINYLRTIEDVLNLQLNQKKIEYIYIHNLKLMLPADKNWDVEETVLPLQNSNATDNKILKTPHILAF